MDKTLDTIRLMLEGSGITLEIFCVTLALSLPLGLFVALGRLSHFRPLSRILEIYIWIMRGTPLMLQLLFVYFALPMVGILLPDIAAALLAFVLNYAAYFAEIFRAGIQAVPRGQFEAARVLGMSAPLTMRRIILPQAMRVIVPPIGNETISMLKTTSLVSAIPYTLELTFVANQKGQELFQPVPLLIAAAIWYLIVTSILMRIQSRIEHHFAKGFDSTSPGDTTFIEVTP